MNLNDLQFVLPSMQASILNAEFTFMNPRPQELHFASSYINQLVINPTGKIWKNLIQTCKYFYHKKSTFPICLLSNKYGSYWNADGHIIDSKCGLPKLWLYDSIHSSAISCMDKVAAAICKSDLKNIYIAHQSLSWSDYQILTSSRSLESLHFYICSFKYSDGTYVTMDKLLGNIRHLYNFKM
uniref:Uncharacterized protein n=1 Tax=Panagrolaimus sp. ES5 TaxID=591445 RepID=A0AC34FTW2_9BILA